MLTQSVTYFRFESFTEGTTTFYAPHNYTGLDDYYFGYDISDYVIKYEFVKNIDSEKDACNVYIDKAFFKNPNNDPKYSSGNLSDPENAFTPNKNDVIIIGNPPNGVPSRSDHTYCYEDESEYSGPGVFVLSSFDDKNQNYIVFVGESFSVFLNGTPLGSTFILNESESNVNDLQIFYEYSDIKKYKSDPIFPAKSVSNKDNNGRYFIELANGTKKTVDLPYYPSFRFTSAVDGSIIQKSGYELPKIAWRILQESGWCRIPYKGSTTMEYITGRPTQPHNDFINPYETFEVDDEYFNENTMYVMEEHSGYKTVKFRAFDTDGLRFDYNFSGSLDLDFEIERYIQVYNESYDPSKQSLLYNLKTLAETSGMYISTTVCPRIELNSDGVPAFVWDYTPYSYYDNFSADASVWGVSVGFHPKVMIRRNPAYNDNQVPFMIEYGVFDEDPETTATAVVSAKAMKWETDKTDMINNILIKYGSNSDDKSISYLEFPNTERGENPYFSMDFYNYMEGSSFNMKVTMELSEDFGLYSFEASAEDGMTARDFAERVAESITSPYLSASVYNNTVIIESTTSTESINEYWSSLDDMEDAISISDSLSNPNYTMRINYELNAIGSEPDGFEKARHSQTRYGKYTYKLSMPEIKSTADAITICDNIFDKLGEPKFRCTTVVNDISGNQLPLFDYFNLVDNSNTHQVLNDEGGSIFIHLTGTATSVGNIYISLPNSSSDQMIVTSTAVSIGDTATTIATKLFNSYDIKKGINPDNYPECTRSDNTLTFIYSPDDLFVDNKAFQNIKTSTNATGIKIGRSVTSASRYVESTYNEYIPLLKYDSNSTSGTHTCYFGLPNETLANIINQLTMWVGDVEKSQ